MHKWSRGCSWRRAIKHTVTLRTFLVELLQIVVVFFLLFFWVVVGGAAET